MTDRGGTLPGRKQKLWAGGAVASGLVGIVLLILLAVGVAGPNRTFLMDHVRAKETMLDLAPHFRRFQDLCANGGLEAPFDSSSVVRVQQWCEAAEKAAGSLSPDDAVSLLKVHKSHFEFVTSGLLQAGDAMAERGLELMEAECVVVTRLETMASITSSAGFGQFILSLLFLGLAAVLIWRGFRTARP
jgi:hypothetical protein